MYLDICQDDRLRLSILTYLPYGRGMEEQAQSIFHY